MSAVGVVQVFASRYAQIKARMRNAFYTDTDTWKGQVIAQARQALFQAVQGSGF